MSLAHAGHFAGSGIRHSFPHDTEPFPRHRGCRGRRRLVTVMPDDTRMRRIKSESWLQLSSAYSGDRRTRERSADTNNSQESERVDMWRPDPEVPARHDGDELRIRTSWLRRGPAEQRWVAEVALTRGYNEVAAATWRVSNRGVCRKGLAQRICR
jgi:hypothetical protein